MNVTDTLEINPSGYSSSNSSYSTISSSYPVSNAYTNTSSTTYTRVTCTTGSGATSYISYTFDTSEIPSDASIDSISCAVKARISSTNYISTAYVQLYNDTSAMGSSTSFRSTSTSTTYTLTCGTWTRSALDNLQLRFTATRGTSNTSSNAYIYVYGANLSITYTWNDVTYTVTTTITNGGVLSDNPATVSQNASHEVKFNGDSGIEFSSMTVNGSSVTPELVTTSGLENGVCLFHLDGNGTDELGNASLTSTGSYNTTTKFGSNSIYLNGSSYITLSLPSDYSPVTFECWFNCTQSNASGSYPTLFSTTAYGNAGGTYMHIDDGSYSTYPVCRSNASSSSSNNGGYGSTVITRNTWHHFAYCRNGSSHYYFIDGNLEYTVTQSSPNSIQNIYIGGLRGSSSMVSGCYMTGYVDEILVSDVCKWTSSFTPPTSAYSVESSTYYSYTISAVTTDTSVVIVFGATAATMYVKVNGELVAVKAAYKKSGNVLIECTDLTTLFDDNIDYVVKME